MPAPNALLFFIVVYSKSPRISLGAPHPFSSLLPTLVPAPSQSRFPDFGCLLRMHCFSLLFSIQNCFGSAWERPTSFPVCSQLWSQLQASQDFQILVACSECYVFLYSFLFKIASELPGSPPTLFQYPTRHPDSPQASRFTPDRPDNSQAPSPTAQLSSQLWSQPSASQDF